MVFCVIFARNGIILSDNINDDKMPDENSEWFCSQCRQRQATNMVVNETEVNYIDCIHFTKRYAQLNVYLVKKSEEVNVLSARN